MFDSLKVFQIEFEGVEKSPFGSLERVRNTLISSFYSFVRLGFGTKASFKLLFNNLILSNEQKRNTSCRKEVC
jgi:hypothetical protein